MTWNVLREIETQAGRPDAAAAARSRALALYAAYRRDGGEPRFALARLIAAIGRTLQEEGVEAALWSLIPPPDRFEESLSRPVRPSSPSSRAPGISARLGLPARLCQRRRALPPPRIPGGLAAPLATAYSAKANGSSSSIDRSRLRQFLGSTNVTRRAPSASRTWRSRSCAGWIQDAMTNR